MLLKEVEIQQMDRESLERLALMRVCACQYYDLADTISEMSDLELLDIINHRYVCEMCKMEEEIV